MVNRTQCFSHDFSRNLNTNYLHRKLCGYHSHTFISLSFLQWYASVFCTIHGFVNDRLLKCCDVMCVSCYSKSKVVQKRKTNYRQPPPILPADQSKKISRHHSNEGSAPFRALGFGRLKGTETSSVTGKMVSGSGRV